MQEQTRPTALSYTYLQSISFPVARSVMTSRTQGGGVIGRRSYEAVSDLLEVVAGGRRLPCHRSRTCGLVEAAGQHQGLETKLAAFDQKQRVKATNWYFRPVISSIFENGMSIFADPTCCDSEWTRALVNDS